MKKTVVPHKIGVWDIKSSYTDLKDSNVHDVMIAEFLLSNGRLVHSEEAVLTKYKSKTLDEVLQKQYEKFSDKPELLKLFEEIEMPVAGVLFDMQQHGILLDVNALRTVGEEIQVEIHDIEDKIKQQVGFDMNLNSSIQVGNFLADKAGVPLSKTKTGRYATNETQMAQYAKDFPLVADILKYRELSKLLSTYVESLISKADNSGRIHTTYHQVAVNTGRLASTNPNMQNIPVTSEFGIKIKSTFVAPKGKVLLSFDYSQQELRILAHLTGEEALIKAFKKNQDVHKLTASKIFGVSYDKVTKVQRSAAKTVNFGIIYGMSSFGLSQGLLISVDEAQKFIDTFFETYPKIKSFYDTYLEEGKKNGYVQTLLGRRRYVFEYPGQKYIDNSMRRVLINYPIQGSAADLMKKAMVDIHREILQKDPSVKLLLQIHDDLVFEVDDKKKKIDDVIKKVKKIMTTVYPLSVPVEVDVKIGKKWGELELIT